MKSRLSTALIAILCSNVFITPTVTQLVTCEKSELFRAGGVGAWTTPSKLSAFFYRSGLAIDADGAFRAYHPNDRLGLDSLSHAGHPGDWWALVTDNEEKYGRPVTQKKSDPAPGYYVSTTALYDPNNYDVRDPHRYVDAASIPYVVLHPKALHYARLGDFATVVNLRNGKLSAGIVADVSAANLPIGEGSIALADILSVDSRPRYGGEQSKVIAYVIYPGSGNGRPRVLRDIVAKSTELFDAWGGVDKLDSCLSN
jgi:hypothetical protein